LAECVGETYSAFLETLTIRQLMFLVRDAHVLDFSQLSDLSSLGMTFRMKNMSVAEIRANLQIPLQIPPLTAEERASAPRWLLGEDGAD